MADADLWDSSRPRAGKRFQPTHELPLQVQAADIGRDLRGATRGLILIRELAGPLGVPDLTALVGDPLPLEARLGLDVPPLLNEIDAAVVGSTHATKPRRIPSIARELGWPEDTVRRRLPGLIKSGALARVGNDSVTRPATLRPVGKIVAIEAKVKDWRAALTQARSYGIWADNYVIVMGSIPLSAMAPLQAQVREDKGGLVVSGRWLIRPRNRLVGRPRRMWASEHFVAALIGTDHQPSERP